MWAGMRTNYHFLQHACFPEECFLKSFTFTVPVDFHSTCVSKVVKGSLFLYLAPYCMCYQDKAYRKKKKKYISRQVSDKFLHFSF